MENEDYIPIDVDKIKRKPRQQIFNIIKKNNIKNLNINIYKNNKINNLEEKVINLENEIIVLKDKIVVLEDKIDNLSKINYINKFMMSLQDLNYNDKLDFKNNNLIELKYIKGIKKLTKDRIIYCHYITKQDKLLNYKKNELLKQLKNMNVNIKEEFDILYCDGLIDAIINYLENDLKNKIINEPTNEEKIRIARWWM
jgi:hypothetical protein